MHRSLDDSRAARCAWLDRQPLHRGHIPAGTWARFAAQALAAGDLVHARYGLDMLCETVLPKPVFRVWCRVSWARRRLRSWLYCRQYLPLMLKFRLRSRYLAYRYMWAVVCWEHPAARWLLPAAGAWPLAGLLLWWYASAR